jgi:hypothetical protein
MARKRSVIRPREGKAIGGLLVASQRESRRRELLTTKIKAEIEAAFQPH